jgi:bromodomain-containing protein 7/9
MLLRAAAQELAIPHDSLTEKQLDGVKQEALTEEVSAQVSKSLYSYPSATVALSALRQIKTHKIDMGALIKTPGELFLSEEEWFGKIFRERRKPRGEEPSKLVVEFEVEEPEKTWMDIDASAKDVNGTGQDSDYELEGPEELNKVLDYVASVIVSLDQNIRDKPSSTPVSKTTIRDNRGISTSPNALGAGLELQEKEDGKSNIDNDGAGLSVSEETMEDPVLRNLRLNLLALAKRAPLDTIARLPKDLVPEHIRHFVPTLGASG